MLKKTALIISFLLLTALPAWATVYSSVLDDLPLMQGMVEKPEDTVIFDKPGGRIVEFSVRTASSADEVKDFYKQALPPLGWKSRSPLKYVRETEALEINFDKMGGKTIVHFALTPAGK